MALRIAKVRWELPIVLVESYAEFDKLQADQVTPEKQTTYAKKVEEIVVPKWEKISNYTPKYSRINNTGYIRYCQIPQKNRMMELTESDYHFICAFKCKYMVGDFTLLTPENLLAAYKFLNSEATSEKSSWLEAYVQSLPVEDRLLFERMKRDNESKLNNLGDLLFDSWRAIQGIRFISRKMVPDTEQYLAVPFKSRWPVFQPLSQYIMKSRHALTRINKKAAQIKFKYEECRKLWIECEVKDKQYCEEMKKFYQKKKKLHPAFAVPTVLLQWSRQRPNWKIRDDLHSFIAEFSKPRPLSFSMYEQPKSCQPQSGFLNKQSTF